MNVNPDANAPTTGQATPDNDFAELSVREKVGYGLGDTASNLYWKLFENFQLIFYTDVFGISAGTAGTMFLVTKMWDAITDPAVGFLSDRTRTAWGRFRPYLLWMAIPFAVTGILAFYTPDLSPRGKIIYAYITYSLVFMAYTAINIPYGALMGVITPNASERTSVSTYRFVLAFLGGLIVQMMTEPLVHFFGSAVFSETGEVLYVDKRTGFFWTVFCYAMLAVFLFCITFLSTKERVQPEQAKSNRIGEDLRDLVTNGPWIALMFFGLFQVMAGVVRGSATAYYFTYFLDAPFGRFLVAGSLAAIVGMLCTRWLLLLFNQRTLIIVATLLTSVLTGAVVLLGSEHLVMVYILHILGSFVSGPVPVLLWAMYADTADYSEWVNHRRATGLVFSAATFSQKFGGAVGAAIPGWGLAYYKFVEPVNYNLQTQSKFTVLGIILLMSVIPAFCIFCSTVAMLFYRLTPEKMGRIEIELRRRKKILTVVDGADSDCNG